MHKQDQKCVWEYMSHMLGMINALASGNYSQEAITDMCLKIGKIVDEKRKEFK